MKSKTLLPSILFTSLLAIAPAAFAQDASATADAAAAAQANVPAQQLAERYAELAGSTEAAAALVQDLRVDAVDGTTMGYGEINTALALSGALVESGAATSFDAAVDTVTQLRADGMGWGEIAQQLGFNLGEVVSASNRIDAGAQAGGAAAAGLSIAEEAQARANGIVEGATAGSLGARTEVGGGADARSDAGARAGAGIDVGIGAGARGATSGRPVGAGVGIGVGAGAGARIPVLPQRPLRPARGGGR